MTANYQNPLGYCFSNTEKQKIAELAAKYQCFIIEDDILVSVAIVVSDHYPFDIGTVKVMSFGVVQCLSLCRVRIE